MIRPFVVPGRPGTPESIIGLVCGSLILRKAGLDAGQTGYDLIMLPIK